MSGDDTVGTLEQLNVTPPRTLGLGLFVSTISQTQQQASMTATFFFLTPMIYLSGSHARSRTSSAGFSG